MRRRGVSAPTRVRGEAPGGPAREARTEPGDATPRRLGSRPGRSAGGGTIVRFVWMYRLWIRRTAARVFGFLLNEAVVPSTPCLSFCQE